MSLLLYPTEGDDDKIGGNGSSLGRNIKITARNFNASAVEILIPRAVFWSGLPQSYTSEMHPLCEGLNSGFDICM